MDDFDLDLDVDLEADVVLEADELDLEAEVLDLEADVLDLDVLVVRGSAMVESVVVLNGWWSKLQFVDVEAVDEATAAEAGDRQMRWVQHATTTTTADTTAACAVQRSAKTAQESVRAREANAGRWMRRSAGGVYSVGNSEGTARAGRRAAPPSIGVWRCFC